MIWLKNILADPFWFSVIWMLILIVGILTATAVCILAERKIAAFIQDRKGPNRVGPWGLLQPVADGLKFLLKEDVIPARVDRPLYFLATGLAFLIAMLGFAIIPWAGEIHWPWMEAGKTVSTQVANLNVGVLYILAVGSMGVYGIVLAGWSSNNKYAFYGGMRATAQMLSYEVPLGLAVLVLLLTSGDLRLDVIVHQQATWGGFGLWNVFLHPVAFVLILTSSFAETNRAPFDLAEAEQELVGGFHTEYSSMKFALFFLGEYAHMITGSALMVALFFGGWHFWGLTDPAGTGWAAALIKLAVFVVKVAAFIGLFMIVRWTLPRFRFDQLMRLAWRGMVPVGIALVLLTSILAALGWQRNLAACLAVNAVLLAEILWLAARSTTQVTGRQPNMPAVVSSQSERAAAV
jgi:NADH-quinone oxidoreductase subunit H